PDDHRRTARTCNPGGQTEAEDPGRSAAACPEATSREGQRPVATRQDADTKGREEDTDHEKHHPLIARDELAERADAKDDEKQHRGNARREDEGGGRKPPASALDDNGNEGGQKRDHATWREQG